ncbi:MAG: YlxR family protein [Chloroflexi bacterium]|nr:YlxR family protein [Chloroflexota bacterium]
MPTPRQRHVPIRTCVGCRQERPKRELVRVVRTPTGEITIDLTGKAAGRGAYLCRAADCWTAALKRDALARALRTTLTPEDREALLRARDAVLAAGAPGGGGR